MLEQLNALHGEINDFTISTGIKIRVFSTEGSELINSGSCSECEICRLAGDPSVECTKTHVKAGEDTLRFGGKYIYLCPMGFVHAASPVLVDGSNIVTAVAGPMLIIDRDEYYEEYIKSLPDIPDLVKNDIRDRLEKINVLSLDKVTAYSNMLYYLASYSSGKDAVKLLSTASESKQDNDHEDNLLQLGTGISDRTEYPLYKERELIDVLSVGDKKTAQRLLNEILGYIFFATGGDIDIIRTRVAELMVQLSRTAAFNGGANRQKIMDLSVEYMKTIWTLETIDDISAWMSRILSSFIQMIFASKDIKHIDVIQRVVAFINNNYMYRISLDEIAKEGFLSSSYLSKLFKAEMKINISTYINNIRVEKSKLLLLDSSLSIVEVATMVGFEEQSYFSKVFKSITGVSPGKFRQLKGHIK